MINTEVIAGKKRVPKGMNQTACGNLRRSCSSLPTGCDTFVAFPPLAPKGTVIFGKNSDRPFGEKQSIRYYPRSNWDSGSTVTCTYIDIPQIEETNAVLLSQIDWMWGAEMGTNEHGVVIGNEAVWTLIEEEEHPALLGMDLVRLGLERGRSAQESMTVITNLLQTYGQGGACAENDPSFTYHNSYLIVDYQEGWVLETVGRHWVAKRITRGGTNISNGLTIQTSYDKSSTGIKEYAIAQGLWDASNPNDFNFAQCFSDGGLQHLCDSSSRQCQGNQLLLKHDNLYTLDSQAMMKILRHHESGICMHGSFETTASMVSELKPDTMNCVHWMTGRPNPCQSEFHRQTVFNT